MKNPEPSIRCAALAASEKTRPQFGGLPEVNVNFMMLVPSGTATLTARRTGTTTTICLQTMTRYTYEPLYKYAVSDPTWLPSGTGVPGENPLRSVNDTAPARARFYRVKVSWRP